MNTLFPIFLKLENREVLVVGGGNVGLEKLQALLSNSPNVKITVLAPQIRHEIKELDVKTIEEIYQKKFLLDKFMVIAATDDKAVNEQVYKDCQEIKILVNVADTPPFCDFYLGSVVKKGDLKIAISTNGKSPTMAKRLREMLEKAFPDNFQETLDNLQAIRKTLQGDFKAKIEQLNEITKNLMSK